MSSRPRRPSAKPELSAVRRRTQKQAGGLWNFGPIPVVGLVGGIGSGKSTMASLMEARGSQIIDADKVGHALLDQKPSRLAVVERFGSDVLMVDDQERINRAALGKLVFADPVARTALERILHPRMRATFEKAIARAVRRGETKLIVLDAAILFEAGWNDICDLVVFLDAPRANRLARLKSDRGWTAEELAAREAAQWPLEKKKELADLIIPNTGNREQLENQLGVIMKRLRLNRVEWFRTRSRASDDPKTSQVSTQDTGEIQKRPRSQHTDRPIRRHKPGLSHSGPGQNLEVEEN